MVRNKEGIWINTELFKPAAKYFEKYGYYCPYEKSHDPTSEYYQYWKEEARRCREGYSVGGVKITGHHYDYLNYSPIMKSVSLTKKAGKKKEGLPDFWDGDYDYFWLLDIARKGISKEDYKALRLDINIREDHLIGGKNVCVGKGRRKGFSFKNASVAKNIYKQYPLSVTVIGAFDPDFLYPSGTMGMAQTYIDFINKHTGWKRSKIIDRQDHLKDGIIKNVGGVNVEDGFRSQIMAVSFYNNPDAARGKDGELILMEEAGKWPGLESAVLSTKKTLEDGDIATGMMVIFGTGGGKATNWKDFEKIFYEPDTYNIIAVENIWDKGASGSYSSFFFPSYKNLRGYIDDQGNSLIKEAKEYQGKIRKSIEDTSSDEVTIKKVKMEDPWSPSEAFSVVAVNIFPSDEAKNHRLELTRTGGYKMGTPGKLQYNSSGDLVFEADYKLKPLYEYPIKGTGITDLSGCVVIYYPPYKKNGKIPKDLYIICHDPYKFDDSTGVESIGASYVIMNPNYIIPSNRGDLIVASWIGRPHSVDEYNRIMFLLAEYYNAKIGFENDTGSVLDYCKRNKHLYKYLEEEFELAWTPEINNKLNRGYGMSMAGGRKDAKRIEGNRFLNEWLRKPRYTRVNKETGVQKTITTLHTIYDIGLLKEIEHYNPVSGNFDRISALRIGMYYMRELDYKERKVEEDNDDSISKFFQSKLYA